LVKLYAHEFWFRVPDHHTVHQQVPPGGIQRRFGAFKVLPSWGGISHLPLPITHYPDQDAASPLDFVHWRWPPRISPHYSATMFSSKIPIVKVFDDFQ
jgi:hypothetical protein